MTLSSLCRLLLVAAPPHFSSLLGLLGETEQRADFRRLVQTLLPDCEAEICQGTPHEQLARFAVRFEERYFPLHPFLLDLVDWEEDWGFGEFLSQVPVYLMGIEEYDLHDLDQLRLGERLVYALMSPVDFYIEGDMGARQRVALLESLAPQVDAAVLRRVPQPGYSLDLLQLRLSGDHVPEEYRCVLQVARRLLCATDTIFLDYSNNGECPYILSWDPETVEELTRQWQQAELVLQQGRRAIEWLEAAPAGNLARLLEFLGPPEEVPLPEPRTLAQIFGEEVNLDDQPG